MSRYPWRDTSTDIAGGQPPQWETPQGAQTKADKALKESKDYTDEQNVNFNAHIEDTTIHVTPADKANWNSKAPGVHTHANATPTTPGFMPAEDKVKLNGVEAEANKYVHPASHPPAIIAQDTGNRFVSDAEKAAWGAKAEPTEATTTVKGLMSTTDKQKLNGIQAAAEVNQNAFSGVNGVVATSKSDTLQLTGGTGITITEDAATKRVTVTATGTATPGAHASSHLPGGTDVIPDAVTGGFSGLMSGADAKFVRQDGETKTGAQAKADAAEQEANEYTDGKVAEVSAEVNQALVDANEYTDERISTVTANYIRQPGYAVTAGTATAYVATLDPVPASLPAGFGITIVPHVASGAAPTLNVNGLGAITLKKQDGSPFAAGDLKANTPYTFRKVGSDFLADSGGGEVKINGQTTASFPYVGNISKNDPVVVVESLELKSVPYNLGNANECTVSPNSLYLAVVFDSSPFIAIYKRNGDTFTKLADPDVLPTGSAYDVAFSPDGNYLVVANLASPYIIIYKRSGDVFTKLANPSVLPAFRAFGVAFSPDGLHLAVGHDTSPYITIYKRSGDTFTKLANPSTLPTGVGRKLAFGDSGNYLAISHGNSPYVTIYKRSGDTFTKLADPDVLPAAQGLDAKFSPDGTYLTVAFSSTPGFRIYERSGDSFTKIYDPEIMPTTSGRGVGFSANGLYMGVALLEAPYFILYKHNGGFSKTADASVPPIGRGNGVAFSPDNTYVFVSNFGAPYINPYKFVKSVAKNNNSFSDLNGVSGAGYALSDGVAGDTKEVVLIWR